MKKVDRNKKVKKMKGTKNKLAKSLYIVKAQYHHHRNHKK